MKALVVYESWWGNTDQIAHAIAHGLESSMEVTVLDVAHATAADADDAALVVAGGPTHALSMSRPQTRADAVLQGGTHGNPDRGLREWLAALPDGAHTAQLVTFDTRVHKARHFPGSAAKSAAKAGRRHGFSPYGSPHSFYVADIEGPLLDGELERATAWGQELAAGARSALSGN